MTHEKSSAFRGGPEVGPDLDALVAEKVMGWTLDADKYKVPVTGALGYNPNHGDAIPAYFANGKMVGFAFKYRFSSNISAAFEVLDRIHNKDVTREDFWPFSKRSAFYKQLEFLCTTEDGLFVAWPAALGIFREQMPEFICRAALAIATDLNWRANV